MKGKEFENFLQSICHIHDVYILRIPDSCSVVNSVKKGKTIIRVKSPFDFILHNKETVLLDTKVTEKKAFYKSMINVNQYVELARASRSGIKAGYLVLFQEFGEITFFNISLLASCLNKEKSLKPQDGVRFGYVEINDFNFDFS